MPVQLRPPAPLPKIFASGVLQMTTTADNASWWVWACWRTRDADTIFLYACAARTARAPGWSKASEAPLAGGGLLRTKQQTIAPADFDAFIAGAADGELDLKLLFGAGAPCVQINARREFIHPALGDTVARTHAYCSMPAADIAFGPTGADLEAILDHLTAELSLPFRQE